MPKHVFTPEDHLKAVAASKVKAAAMRKNKPPKERTGRPQSDFFGGKAHTWSMEDCRKSAEARRRKREQKEADEKEAQKLAADPRLIGYTSDPLGHARRLVELQRLYEAAEAKRFAKQSNGESGPDSTARRTLMKGETPLEGLKRLNFNLYRDLLVKANFDESKVLSLLEASGRLLWG